MPSNEEIVAIVVTGAVSGAITALITRYALEPYVLGPTRQVALEAVD